MLLLFSRPIEFLGLFGFIFILIGFVVISIASSLLWLIFFRSKTEKGSKGEEVRSWIAGSAAMGIAFLIINLILAVPAMILLSFLEVSVIEPAFDSSDETFHKVDSFLTFSGIVINLICYFLAVKIYRRKIYGLFYERRKK